MAYNTLVALFVLVGVASAVDIKYSDLTTDHVVNLDIKLSYSHKDSPKTAYNSGNPCPIDGDEGDNKCQDPVFNYDDNSKLIIDFTIPDTISTLKKAGEEPLGEAELILFKLCYGKPWTKDRKWRKIKDKISKDKRCKKKMGTVDIKGKTSGELTYEFKSDTPTAQWFVTAYIKCPFTDKEGDEFCAIDTTGGLQALDKTAPAPGPGDTSDTIYVKTSVIDSRTTGLYVTCIVLSVTSVSLLVGFFVFEHLLKKNK